MSFVAEFNSLPLDALVKKSLGTSTAAAREAVGKDKFSLADFAALISPAASENLEAMGRRAHLMTQQRFGKVISIETTFVTSDVARRGPQHYLFDPEVSGGGFFSWLACHQLDLLFYLTQQAIVGVTARVGVFGEQATKVEDGGVAILELESGGLVTFIGGYWIPRWTGESHWRLRGSQRWVEWDPTRKQTGGALDIPGT